MSGGRAGRSPRLLVLVAMVVLLAAVADGAGAENEQAPTGAFNGTASSDLVRVVATPEPAVLLDPLLDPGATMAQAAVDSLGASSAYAKSVFPGTLYGLLPGIGSLTGAAVPVPPNPLEVASAHPSTPEAEQSAGTLALHATSRETSSSGSATNGVDRAMASVTADVDLGDVVSTAEAAVSAIRISDVLVVHGVHVSAKAARNGAGELERSSSLDVTAISVGGQRIALAPGTLELLGTPTELPLVSPIRSLLSTLADAGIVMEYVPEVELDDGVQSAALRINLAMQPPQDAGFSGVEHVRVVVTIGGAIATAGSGALGSTIEPAPAVPTGDSFESAPLAAGPAVGSASTGVVGAPSSATGSVPAVASEAPVVDAALTSVVVPGIRNSLVAFYPILVLAAALVYGLARASSHLAGGHRR